MIIWLLVILVIVIFLIIWCFVMPDTKKNAETHIDESIVPTMYAKCDINSVCGGDLICDKKCLRCKKKKDGECATDNDCESGLKCHNWKCSEDIHDYPEEADAIRRNPHASSRKSVKWNMSGNEIYNIPRSS